jgi:hypothetical protein
VVRIPALAVSALAVVASAAGCGGGSHAAAETVTSRTKVPNARPVTPHRVAAELRKHGFEAVTATVAQGGAAGVEVGAGDGLLDCMVYDDGTSYGDTIEVRGPGEHSGAMWHGTKADVSYMNMSCQLYPKDGYARQQTAQLAGAVRELAGLGPATRG